ncbi:uncharacterized protein PAC_07698 [Phialocephala subalpina]|uniref:Extracellular membrane protein CFEM domain-containing protein n=1 Tax=Phialocephala subalpina TaxID=576137 RepID=A0A1L7WYG0_9HELO|nr:uncharacterized protein PAC_07698 [Phialocephala subalpina]
MNTQLFQLVFFGCTCLLSCQGLAATRPPTYRDRSQLLIPRQTVSGSSPPTFTVYTTVSALDPFQTQATSTQTTFSSSTITRSPTSTTILTVTVTVTYVGPFLQNSGCSLASQEIVYCTSLSPGFLTMPYESKTSCLCSFGGEPFNSAVSICAQYASTADIGLYSELASWEGFCNTLTSSSPISKTTTPTRTFSSSTGGPGTGTQSPSSSPTSSATTPNSSNGIAALTTPQRAGIISGCTIFGVGLGGLAAYAACFKGKRTSTSTEKEKKKNDIATSGVVAPAASPLMQKSEFPSPEISEDYHPLPKRATV